VLHAAATGHICAGRLLDAHISCQQAFASDPDNPETMNLIAVVHTEAKEFDHAVEWASLAIRKDPKPQYLTTLGEALRRSGRLDEAIKVFDKAVGLKPGDAALWFHLGNALLAAERLPDALLCFRHAVSLDPRHADAAHNAGCILHRLGQFEEALAFLDKSIALRPDQVLTLKMRCIVLKEMKRIDDAFADSERAIRLDPGDADICNNHGTFLNMLERREDALLWYDRALAIKPDHCRALTNKGAVLNYLGRLDEALAAHRRAATADPDFAEATWNLALLQMLMGDFEAGWRGREARWKISHLSEGYPQFSKPKWLGGESVAGKTVVVCQDEGIGDAIQFARYVPMLASRDARVILIVDEPLCPLLSGLKGVSVCLPKSADAALPPFDFHVPLDSLPMVFNTTLDTIPAQASYLPPPDRDRVQAWESRLGAHERLRVGLVWSGNPKHHNDHRRSMPLRTMSRLIDVDAMFVSLQTKARPEDADFLRQIKILDRSRELTDFAETAALVSCLDLVITVDTSVAHLAAALGRPTWILLPQMPDFRWLLDRDDSPWYPTVRLFRQTETREYGSVLDRVHAELVTLAGRFAEDH
jgi:Flp pilus assembly protein TadD